MTDTATPEASAAPTRKLAYMINGDAANPKPTERVSLLLNSRWRSFPLASEQGQRLVELLRQDPQDIEAIGEIADVPTFIAKQTHGRVTVDDCERLRLDGKLIDYGLTGRVSKIVEQGVSFVALANFVERVSLNPDPTVPEDLYRFMEKGNLPLDPEGYILAFKKVDDEYWSFRAGDDGKVQYTPGTSPSMPREKCDPNRNQTCSRGLHACSYEYLKFWYPQKGRVVIVRIDPEHVTAIPADHNDQKLRCCQMEVVGEIDEADAAAHFVKVVDERYMPEPEPPVEAEAEDDALELTERVDGESPPSRRLVLKPVSDDDEDQDEPVNLDPAHWSQRGYSDGKVAGEGDRENDYSYRPEFEMPAEIADEEAARAAYTKAFVEAYDAAYRAAPAPADEDEA